LVTNVSTLIRKCLPGTYLTERHLTAVYVQVLCTWGTPSEVSKHKKKTQIETLKSILKVFVAFFTERRDSNFVKKLCPYGVEFLFRGLLVGFSSFMNRRWGLQLPLSNCTRMWCWTGAQKQRNKGFLMVFIMNALLLYVINIE